MLKRDKALGTEEYIQNYDFKVIQNNHKDCVLESFYNTYLESIQFLVVQAMEQSVSYPKMGMNIDKEDLCAYKSLGGLPKATVAVSSQAY